MSKRENIQDRMLFFARSSTLRGVGCWLDQAGAEHKIVAKPQGLMWNWYRLRLKIWRIRVRHFLPSQFNQIQGLGQKKTIGTMAMPPSNNDILAVSELLAVGLTHHQAGRLGEAEAIYRHVLQQQTENAEALHLLGVIAHQCGNHEVAIELIEFAIKINPNIAEFYNNCGEVKRALHKTKMRLTALKKPYQYGRIFLRR